MVSLVGCAVLVGIGRGAGEEGSGAANEGKQEITAQDSLDDLIQNQVEDYALQKNEPLKPKPKDSIESRTLTYESSDGTVVNHVVGFVVPKYAYYAKSADSETFADTYVKGSAKGLDLGGEPERSEFQIEDENSKEVGRGVLLQGTQSDALFWINGRLNAAVKAPTGEAQDFYNKLTY
jgi:hypothetical protein